MPSPAVPKNEARVRPFVTFEHAPEQIERCARFLLDVSDSFAFRL